MDARVAWPAVVAALAAPVAVSGQAAATVSGRVHEVGVATGIPNAIVEIVGHGATLTTPEGRFRFESVAPDRYVLRVTAFGYVATSRELAVRADTSVAVGLEASPLPIDSLVVDLRAIDVGGRVRDRDRDVALMNVEVLTNHRAAAVSSPRGRFRLEDVWEGVPVLVSVRAFGYLPVDTVVVPAEDDRYDFELERDPVVARMIDAQVARLRERMGGRRAILTPPIDRERLLGWTGVSLWEVLTGTYPTRLRVRCVVVDEEPVVPAVMRNVLETTLPGEVECMEFLFGGAMLRVYTRGFMRDLVAGIVELREPLFVGVVSPPLCG